MEEYYQQQLLCLTGKVSPASRTAARECRCQWDSIAKPLNGLGEFENMICRIGAIQGTSQVRLGKRAVAVFCGDNGVTAEGVTQTDSSVTAVVTENFARGIASVNRMAALADVDVVPVDLGVAGEIREPGVQNCKIARGTGNIRREPAMTREQALAAIHEGIRLAGELHGSGYDILAAGEMGIGNTTTSSAIVSVMLGEPVEAVTGRGAGLSRAGLEQKIQVIRDAIALHRPDPEDPVQVLADLGGFDIAGITGFLLGGAIYRIPVVLDGMISLAAALLARKLCPLVTEYLLASHIGREPACKKALERLGLRPVICGDLALGEGTGAVMLFPLLDMACEVYRENPTFSEIRIEAYERFED